MKIEFGGKPTYLGSSISIDRRGDAYPVYWVGERRGDFSVVRRRTDRKLVCVFEPDVNDCIHVLLVLAKYRQREITSEPLAFGVWARVVQRGVVRVGDPIEVA